MDSKLIQDLEDKVGRAVQLIAGLKNEKYKLEKENGSLRRQVEDLRSKIVDLEKLGSSKPADPAVPRTGFDGQAIKARLEKLVGKLAALEDSWN
jgi:FtsZ-binding cell division protein ZapB